MKFVYSIFFILFCNSMYSQGESTKFIWGKIHDRSDSPTRRDFITATDEKYFFTSMVRMPNIQDILIFDNKNNLIGKKQYHKMHVIKGVIEFDKDNIYLISLKKEKGIFKYYASKFDAKTGDFGELFLVDEIKEETSSIQVFITYKYPDKDLAGWVMSPDKEKIAFVHSVGSKKEEGNLNLRISYFDNKLKKTDTKIIKTPYENIKNDIKSFTLLNNNSVVVLIKQFKNGSEAKEDFKEIRGITFRGRKSFESKNILLYIDKNGNQEIKTFNSNTYNQELKSTKDDFYYVSNSENSVTINKFDADFDLIYETDEIVSEQNSELHVYTLKDKLLISFEQFYIESYTYYDKRGAPITSHYRVYRGTNVIMFDGDKKEYNSYINNEYSLKTDIIGNEIYSSYYENDKVTILRYSDLKTTIIPTQKIGDDDISQFFWNLNDKKLLFEVKRGNGSYQLGKKKDVYQFGTINIADLKFKESKTVIEDDYDDLSDILDDILDEYSNAKKLKSGAYYVIEEEGKGREVKNHRKVSVIIKCLSVNDEDLEIEEFKMDIVLGENIFGKEIDEVIALMREGSKYKIIIPYSLSKRIKATEVWDVKVLKVK